MNETVTVDHSIMRHFAMVMDFDNESQEYIDAAEKEFKAELAKSLGALRIRWKNKQKAYGLK